jgi:hypothetical protein
MGRDDAVLVPAPRQILRMPRRIRPPATADAPSVLAVAARALALYESAGMAPTWHAERWEKALGRA